MKYIAHIVSHSHWDREWYLPYEQHHMRLIELIDDILNQIETDPDFSSFHLDGQTICIDDYLEVKPQNREKLFDAIKRGKIKVGPWYILQDAFLTSSEANVRNMQVGNKMASAIGPITKVGYYPDTFGVYGQAAQILKQSDINNMFFGRGVSPTGFNNEVADSFTSTYSELFIKSPDQSKVLGILFANWYSNGNEVPSGKIEAKKWWDIKLADAKKFAQTNQLLFMNGCDHQPLQKDLSLAIKVANELYDDVEFRHSSLEEYLKECESCLDHSSLSTVDGELRSQNTDGHYTLVNTASSRIYQKQKNSEIQNSFEKLAEPLSAMLKNACDYPTDMLDFGWKKLMQNHPHDSICGCSVDSVHRSMDARFEDAKEVSNFIIKDALLNFKDTANTKGIVGNIFTIFNPMAIEIEKTNEVIIDFERAYFKDMPFNKCRIKMEEVNIEDISLFDLNDNKIDCDIIDLGSQFDYDLPKDGFRIPFYARKLKVIFSTKCDSFSSKTFVIKKGEKTVETKIDASDLYTMENGVLKVVINDNGTINIENKKDNLCYNNILKIEDMGDIGNEYMFGQVKNDTPIFMKDNTISLSEENSFSMQKRIIKGIIELPKSADVSLLEEKRKLVEFYGRSTKRSTEMVQIPITITLVLDGNDDGLSCNVAFNNTVLDHRMRVLFNTSSKAEFVEVDSIYEIVKRPTVPSKYWKNEQNDGHQSKFINLHNQLTIANMGLCEYTILNQDTIAITIHRSSSELGDWGHFETPEAQCLREISVDFKIYVHNEENKFKVFDKAQNQFINFPYIQLNNDNDGLVELDKKYINLKKDDRLSVTSVKRSYNNEFVIRMYNMDEHECEFNLDENFSKTNLLESVKENVKDSKVQPFEIYSLVMEENE
ncbi:MAG: glycoside hydrolase family 38 C-terminal domain-containing protein [Mycoplasmatales bacterium]